MSYCHACGSKIESGDVFCNNCGTKQVQASSGEVTGNQLNQNQEFAQCNNTVNSNIGAVQNELANSYKNLKSQVDFSGVGDVLLKMLLKPVTGAKDFIKNAEKSSVIGITILLTIVQGILGIWKVSQVISSLGKVAVGLAEKMATLSSIVEPGRHNLLGSSDMMGITGEINKIKSFIKIPYFKIFFQNSALFIISIAILFIIMYLGINVICKKRSEAFTLYKTAVIVLVPTLYFELFSIICSYFSFYIGFYVALIGVIISIGCLTIVVKEELPIDENHSVVVVAIASVAIFICISMMLGSFVSSNISDIVMSTTNVMKGF